MTGLVALTAAGLASWVLRIFFITLICPARLPAAVRAALPHVGPAVLAALIATSLVRGGGATALVVPSPRLLALVVAGVVAWRVRSLVATTAAALASFWLLTTLAG
jgi:branched-subunit amino acid transport protein